ncbi:MULTISPECIES: PAS domain-containing protein [Acidithiobacillus]|uniref:PAS domain-containing protein n=1 Tax=Acidithiobacillus ferruginosus TaxID=3063951 RepID=UPI001C06FFBE|nr:PAS domain-containing protein [Acidithiobacillus ferruginosus]
MSESIVDTVRDPMIVLDGEIKIITFSHSFFEKFQITREHAVGPSFLKHVIDNATSLHCTNIWRPFCLQSRSLRISSSSLMDKP